jgi:hypothetical protein
MQFLTSITTKNDEYLLELINTTPATDNTDLTLQFSADGGATWLAGSNYSWALSYIGVPSDAGQQATAATASIRIAGGMSNVVAQAGGNIWIRIFAPLGTTQNKRITFDTSHSIPAGGYYRLSGTGVLLSTAAVNAVRVLFSSGNIASGIGRMYGFAK